MRTWRIAFSPAPGSAGDAGTVAPSFFIESRKSSNRDVGKNEHGKRDCDPAAEHGAAFFECWSCDAKDLARVAHIGVNLTSNRQLSLQLRIRHEPLFHFCALARRQLAFEIVEKLVRVHFDCWTSVARPAFPRNDELTRCLLQRS